MLTPDAIDRQEALFARAFATRDLELARPLYDPDVRYVSPTVRLFDWPRRIDGVDRTLEFIGLTIARCHDIAYRCVERALVDGAPAAYVRVEFDWTAEGRRLRSTYVVSYRYRDARIVRQEIHYDPSAPPEVLPAA
jgi:ketosteroid isomerase-like protein